MREAAIVPNSDHGPVRETRRDARRAIPLHMVFAAPRLRRLRWPAAASLRSGTKFGTERRRSLMQSDGLGVLVLRGIKGPRLIAGIWWPRTAACHLARPCSSTVIETGQSIVVRINGRGPFGRGRIIDISRAAADQLGMLRDGVVRVRLELVGSAGAGEGCPFQQARLD